MSVFIIFGVIIAIVLCFCFPAIGCLVTHCCEALVYSCRDVFGYFYERRYNDARPSVGHIECFQGLFGKGKTLAETMTVRRLYKRYNNKKIRKKGKWYTQKVTILANIDLKDVPYIPFNTLSQLVYLADGYKSNEPSETEGEDNVINILYVILDECQIILNSRRFKDNFEGTDVMKVLTQMRKYNCSIWYTSTRFNQTDAFVRQDTMNVNNCNKVWRLLCFKVYDAWEVENCSNPATLKPIHRRCYFVRNSDYEAYDTMKLSDIVSKDIQNGSMDKLSDRVINFNNYDIQKECEKKPKVLSRH